MAENQTRRGEAGCESSPQPSACAPHPGSNLSRLPPTQGPRQGVETPTALPVCPQHAVFSVTEAEKRLEGVTPQCNRIVPRVENSPRNSCPFHVSDGGWCFQGAKVGGRCEGLGLPLGSMPVLARRAAGIRRGSPGIVGELGAQSKLQRARVHHSERSPHTLGRLGAEMMEYQSRGF